MTVCYYCIFNKGGYCTIHEFGIGDHKYCEFGEVCDRKEYVRRKNKVNCHD